MSDVQAVPPPAVPGLAAMLASRYSGQPTQRDLDVAKVAAAAGAAAERERRDVAYAERDQLVAALSKCFPSHLATHDGDDWEDDWRNIVCVHLPTGQATWHIHDAELPWFAHLAYQPEHWDGHTTDEKYRRLADLSVYHRAERRDYR